MCIPNDNSEYARTYLDTNSNLVVLEKICHVTNHTSRTVEVQPFSPEHKPLHSVPIVDDAIKYNDPYTKATNVLAFKNAPCVPAMDSNIMPPFLLREEGLIVDDVSKTQASSPTMHHRSMHFPMEIQGTTITPWCVLLFSI